MSNGMILAIAVWAVGVFPVLLYWLTNYIFPADKPKRKRKRAPSNAPKDPPKRKGRHLHEAAQNLDNLADIPEPIAPPDPPGWTSLSMITGENTPPGRLPKERPDVKNMKIKM